MVQKIRRFFPEDGNIVGCRNIDLFQIQPTDKAPKNGLCQLVQHFCAIDNSRMQAGNTQTDRLH